MTHTLKHLTCLPAVLVFGAALAQPSLQAKTVAYVYVTVNNATYVYDASSTGALKAISGSPFATAGNQVGTNGKYFVTIGTSDLNYYAVASNGAVGKLGPHADTNKYNGSQCGNATAGVFDHTGAAVFVAHNGAAADGGLEGVCDAFQTFSLFSTEDPFVGNVGTTIFDQGRYASTMSALKVSGANTYAFNTVPIGQACEVQMEEYFVQNGTLNLNNNADFQATNPKPEPGVFDGYFATSLITDDPTSHLAVIVYPEKDAPCGTTGPYQLASYAISSSNGNVSSTNTWANMPTLASSSVYDMKLDPTGKYLAVATGTGVQFFHFNGASPITAFTGIIGTSGYIRQLAWDSTGHLYAQNGSSGKMHVYDVTSSGVTEASGSPTVVPIGSFTVRAE